VTEPFQIQFTEGAEADLGYLTPFARRAVMDGAEVHLRHEPTAQSRRIKAMRPNRVAEWELRLGDYRVLYDVDESSRRVTIQVIGEKRGNQLIVQGQEYTAHEDRRS
jgi:mRNA-degrading endonuclease RelE of RelBE toxin-antitoxin system